MKAPVTFLVLFSYFSTFSQNDHSTYSAHEWGTFTTLCGTDGTRLSGLFVDEEKLPYFVARIAYNYISGYSGGNEYKGWPASPDYTPLTLHNVNVKMETPVIYFYSDNIPEDTVLPVDVKVDFPGGSIGEWYPNRVSGEQLPPQVRDYPNALKELDFAMPYHGWIQWQSFIMPEKEKDNYSRLYEGNHIWNSPRETESNMIYTQRVASMDINGNATSYYTSYEKFLFYRGLGHFDLPLDIHYSDRKTITVENKMEEEIPFYILYQIEDNDSVYNPGKARVWSIGQLNSGERKEIPLENSLDVIQSLQDFEDALVENGLFRDEAKAMLKTWNTSYFKKTGMKLFWILPRSYTDEILPINLDPQPEELERVMVGRSEILTPEFEEKLFAKYFLEGKPFHWLHDRYYHAYEERAEQLKVNGLQFQDYPEGSEKSKVLLFPNPVEGELSYVLPYSEEFADVSIYTINGKLLFSQRVDGQKKGVLNLQSLSKGVYLVKFIIDDHEYHNRIIKN